ncbi:alpha/beta fold hydrolase [Curtobacterium sp. MCBA15_008]|uniref:alpha/beta fold hydrolase n=1 Tax=Curtobacterium sp. MCBA15_008 TaxID=1898736 RepID=UPI0008DE52AA|nr:alpha/beta hydrolase [Curtobacterium sp. MCBA15_008]OII09058.1 alpha/beta hydrolase [Curtobacterium sp. MCBA15_008]
MSITSTSPIHPTVILVHGAFADASSWNGVVRILLDQGFPVIAVANPLRGVAADAAYLRALLADVSGDILLVGHSYGGTVITNGATDNPQVRGLVYVGGFAPDSGESAADLAGRYEGGTLGDTLTAVPLGDAGNDLYIQQEKYHEQFAADSPADVASVMAVTQRPIVEAALNEPSTAPAWKQIPSWFLFGSDDKNIPVASHRYMAERAGSRRTVEIRGGSHTVGIPEAAQVADLISEAAGSVR